MKTHYSLFLFLLLLGSNTLYGQTIRYVKPTATGTGDGSSWANASANLQGMMDASAANDEVWVAAGTYLPTEDHTGNASPTDNRDKNFHLKTDIKLYGGFIGDGTETSSAQADPTANVTILSGDFNGNDVVTGGGSTLSFTNNTENAYHVMITANLTNSAVISGFTFSGGNASGSGSITYDSENFRRDMGGGQYNYASPTVTNCSFAYNNANYYGGGQYNDNFSSTLANCSFTYNNASRGGGQYNDNSSPTLTNCSFAYNSASKGGGQYNYRSSSSPMLTNCSFTYNSATSGGGGQYNASSSSPSPILTNCSFAYNSAYRGGGQYNSSSPTLTNCSFAYNSTSSGGGQYNDNASPTLTNCSFVYNSASLSGGGQSNSSSLSSSTLTNCIFWNNTEKGNNNVTGADIDNISSMSTVTVTYCLTQENSTYSSGTGIINNQDPLFLNAADPDGADNIWFTADDGLTLTNNSPAISVGNDAANSTTTDAAGNTRKHGVIDLGAYENIAVLPVELTYFKGKSTTEGSLLTWQTATEENNEGFEIQHSANGRDWNNIGFVLGNGTTQEIQNYQFIDQNPKSGINYYRLKQIDLPTGQAGFDGQFEYSNIIHLTTEQSNNTTIQLFPNPVTDELNIIGGQGQATIYNLLGQPVKQFTINTEQSTINVTDLPSGQYILHIQSREIGRTIATQRFVK